MKNTHLVQTRVTKSAETYLKRKAAEEGISVAAYLRRMIIREQNSKK